MQAAGIYWCQWLQPPELVRHHLIGKSVGGGGGGNWMRNCFLEI